MISLRPATATDLEWAYQVKKQALGEYVVMTWGAWYEKIQHTFFTETFRELDSQVICWANEPAGLLRVERKKDEIFLSELYLLPLFQNLGIGSQLLESLKTEAHSRGIPLKLTVLQVNEPARRFYERHGLVCSAEIENHFVMTYHG
ncbi:GNAT family N-acetyltransferase [Siphonobacter aquaeclarae]|uniref:Ribosomal protein S18 acetylase RimI n=1 Tax=Siphonobacter aquaeclarae TaxID=563176 RepID=A0A1G9X280_9BACT|nr:GNAT family N-acetyltransferase [Siphonobacter aquaeclarae]SDM90556.1 Ribosomal protein S18 acetylase RimI [Siphonobacter aquaeclarae]